MSELAGIQVEHLDDETLPPDVVEELESQVAIRKLNEDISGDNLWNTLYDYMR